VLFARSKPPRSELGTVFVSLTKAPIEPLIFDQIVIEIFVNQKDDANVGRDVQKVSWKSFVKSTKPFLSVLVASSLETIAKTNECARKEKVRKVTERERERERERNKKKERKRKKRKGREDNFEQFSTFKIKLCKKNKLFFVDCKSQKQSI
jgi:hypothetical protein